MGNENQIAAWERGDWVVLYSDVQNAYHVERREQYEERGPTNGNWQIVAEANDIHAAFTIAAERKAKGADGE